MDDVAARMQELRGLRAKELRQELRALGLSTEGRIDRDALLELLESRGEQAIRNQAAGKARKSKRGGAKGFGEEPQQPAAGGPGAPTAPAAAPLPPPASPVQGIAKIPIYMTIGVDQYGLKAGGGRVVALDLEVGLGATPGRFIIDTVSHHTMIKSKVSSMLLATDLGVPSWVHGEVPSFGIRQVSLGGAWLGKLECGELKIAAVDGELPVPLGVCGILGLDFVRLFDWDLDVANERAEVATLPKVPAPVPFSLEGMRMVPFTKVRLPTLVDLLACPVQVSLPTGGSAGVGCMGIIDLCASSSVCNKAVYDRLGLTSVAIGSGASADSEKPAPSGMQEMRLRFGIGDGPDGPAEAEASVPVGDCELFETMGLASNWPCMILGPDLLCRSRLILSPRLNSMWLRI